MTSAADHRRDRLPAHESGAGQPVLSGNRGVVIEHHDSLRPLPGLLPAVWPTRPKKFDSAPSQL